MPILMPLPYSLRNHKRHTRRTRWLAIGTLVSIALFLIVTCAPRGPIAIPRARIVAATAQPSAVPTIAEARRLGTQADAHSATAAARVGSAKTGMGESHTEIQG